MCHHCADASMPQPMPQAPTSHAPPIHVCTFQDPLTCPALLPCTPAPMCLHKWVALLMLTQRESSVSNASVSHHHSMATKLAVCSFTLLLIPLPLKRAQVDALATLVFHFVQTCFWSGPVCRLVMLIDWSRPVCGPVMLMDWSRPVCGLGPDHPGLGSRSRKFLDRSWSRSSQKP